MRISAVRLSALALLGCIALSTTAAAGPLMVAGGKLLTMDSTTFCSDKVITPGGTTDPSYRLTFEAPFQVDSMIVRMESESGKEITAGAKEGITGIRVTYQPEAGGQWQARGSATLSRPAANGRVELTSAVPKNKRFQIDVAARTTATAVRFTVSFATRRAGVKACLTISDTILAGRQAAVARPVLPLTTGLLLRIKNEGKDALGFARVELAKGLPEIDSVTVPDKGFNVTKDGRNAFTLRGDAIAPDETVEVLVTLKSSAAASGSLVVRVTRS